jgi:threonine dehydratase
VLLQEAPATMLLLLRLPPSITACHVKYLFPAGASLSKMKAVLSYGATLTEGGDTLSDAVAAAQEHGKRLA